MTKSIRDLGKELQDMEQYINKHPRPKTRSDCENAIRPCPWVGCKYHLYLDVAENGSIKFNFPDLSPKQIPESCALDVAAQGEKTLDEVGNLLNLSRERIRQIESKVTQNLGKILQEMGPDTD